MANESVVSLPPNVEDPLVLRRVLARIIEALDVATGARSSTTLKEYVSKKELTTISESIEADIKALKLTLTQQLRFTPDQQAFRDALIQIAANVEAISSLGDRVTSNEQAIIDLAARVTINEQDIVTKMEWRGAWAAGAYTKNSVVKDSGITWIALVDTSGVPSVSVDWESLV